MHIFRRMACRANGITPIILARHHTAKAHPGVRILTLWNDRRQGEFPPPVVRIYCYLAYYMKFLTDT